MSKIEMIYSALERYRHRERIRLLNDSYRRLRTDKSSWDKELEETLEDGFE